MKFEENVIRRVLSIFLFAHAEKHKEESTVLGSSGRCLKVMHGSVFL